MVRKRWFTPPWGRYKGITLYPFIFMRAGWSADLMRHELIHCLQVRQQGWLGFYAGYLWQWRLGWKWLGGTTYHELDAEREAYRHQHNPRYLPPDLEALVRSDYGRDAS